MYRWLVFLHILSGFAFIMAHGVSAGVYFMLGKERDVDRIKLLLNLSRSSLPIVTGSLLLVILTGVLSGIFGKWWGQWWIRIALFLMFVLWGAMAGIGSRILNQLRQGLGLQSSYNQPPNAEQLSPAALDALLKTVNPVALAAIGFGGIALILGLMWFKPF